MSWRGFRRRLYGYKGAVAGVSPARFTLENIYRPVEIEGDILAFDGTGRLAQVTKLMEQGRQTLIRVTPVGFVRPFNVLWLLVLLGLAALVVVCLL